MLEVAEADRVEPESAQTEPAQLSTRDRRILAFERHWFHDIRAKEAAITDQFQLTSTRYFQILNRLLDDPRAMRQDPQTVARLRRLRLSRRRSRYRRGSVLSNRR